LIGDPTGKGMPGSRAVARANNGDGGLVQEIDPPLRGDHRGWVVEMGEPFRLPRFDREKRRGGNGARIV
jgi:hypothetical protein